MEDNRPNNYLELGKTQFGGAKCENLRSKEQSYEWRNKLRIHEEEKLEKVIEGKIINKQE